LYFYPSIRLFLDYILITIFDVWPPTPGAYYVSTASRSDTTKKRQMVAYNYGSPNYLLGEVTQPSESWLSETKNWHIWDI